MSLIKKILFSIWKKIYSIPIIKLIMDTLETPIGITFALASGLGVLVVKGRYIENIQKILGFPDSIWGLLTIIDFVIWITFLYMVYLFIKKRPKSKQFEAMNIALEVIKMIVLLFVLGFLASFPSTYLLYIFVYVLGLYKLSLPIVYIGLIHFVIWGLFLALFLHIGLKFMFKKRRRTKRKKLF